MIPDSSWLYFKLHDFPSQLDIKFSYISYNHKDLTQIEPQIIFHSEKNKYLDDLAWRNMDIATEPSIEKMLSLIKLSEHFLALQSCNVLKHWPARVLALHTGIWVTLYLVFSSDITGSSFYNYVFYQL